MLLSQVLKAIRPNAEWNLQGDGYAGLVWLDQVQSKPTESEIAQYIKTFQYKDLRKAEYPSLADLADAVYWQSQGNDAPMKTYLDKCTAVKVKYPKS